jgi:hypothetical protein
VRFEYLLSVLMGLAMLLGPVAIPAAAVQRSEHHAAAVDMPGHCADEPQPPADEKAGEDCCVVTCAAIAAVGGEPSEPIGRPVLPRRPGTSAGSQGLDPQADPPPPRFA